MTISPNTRHGPGGSSDRFCAAAGESQAARGSRAGTDEAIRETVVRQAIEPKARGAAYATSDYFSETLPRKRSVGDDD
jgi:hypothetical protein